MTPDEGVGATAGSARRTACGLPRTVRVGPRSEAMDVRGRAGVPGQSRTAGDLQERAVAAAHTTRSDPMPKASTCLWFARDAEEAVHFYVSLVPGSSLGQILRAPGPWPGGEPGDVILLTFTLGGQSFQALNGGVPADYGMAASISVSCTDQAEVDRVWDALIRHGGSEIMCGWLRDRWGVPWQIVPEALPRLLADADSAVAARVFAAMQSMIKLDVAALQRAADGSS